MSLIFSVLKIAHLNLHNLYMLMLYNCVEVKNHNMSISLINDEIELFLEAEKYLQFIKKSRGSIIRTTFVPSAFESDELGKFKVTIRHDSIGKRRLKKAC